MKFEYEEKHTQFKLNSDCIIFEDDMTRLGDSISLSKKSYRRINQSKADLVGAIGQMVGCPLIILNYEIQS